MSNKPITMLQIRRILQLKANNKSNREIARELHLARNTVNFYVKQLTDLDKGSGDLLNLNDQELSSLAFKEPSIQKADWRLTDLQNRIPTLCDELRKPHATKMILWEEYHSKMPEGYGYTQFCEHLTRYLETQKAVMHFEHEPAASVMFDFAGDKIALVDEKTGEITWCSVLVCVLPFQALPISKQCFLLTGNIC
jgi:transposase